MVKVGLEWQRAPGEICKGMSLRQMSEEDQHP
jgi:hypothetical protein